MKGTSGSIQLPTNALLQIKNLPFLKINSGKVRDIFQIDDNLLIFSTDRLSAFDVVMNEGVPGKGIILNQISLYWFSQTEKIIPNHLIPDHTAILEDVLSDYSTLIQRAILVKKLTPLPIEAVVRGYLAGSAWETYQKNGTLWDQKLPADLKENDPLPTLFFTPTTKAKNGHDEPISLDKCRTLLGETCFEKVRKTSFQLFENGAQKALKAGLILADTKFEFGHDEQGNLFLIDEVLTPDAARYWSSDEYVPGKKQYAFDKQYVRDYLNHTSWNKKSPPPSLPNEIIKGTQERYLKVWKKLQSNQ